MSNEFEDRADWLDDEERFGTEGAVITVTSTSGEYTDFELSAEQVRVVFRALADHALKV